MRLRGENNFLFAVLLSLMLVACGRKEQSEKTAIEKTRPSSDFSIRSFNALSNYDVDSKDSIKVIQLEYFDAVNTGFRIPGIRQAANGKFVSRFQVQNNSGVAKSFSYKIYYQNESYKFPVTDSSGKLNELSLENFYGSWEDSTVLFKSTPVIPADGEYHDIVDSINIVGNPRNEKIFYENGKNDRWKRNPRVGVYSFLLVITDQANLNKNIPAEVQNISLSIDSQYMQPYFYFLHGDGDKLKNTLHLFSSNSLKVVAHPDLGSGIYADRKYFKEKINSFVDKPGCGTDTGLFRSAAFSQFLHYIDVSTRLENIPVVADVLRDNYSQREYNWNRSFYRKEELIGGTPMTADLPCETVYSDPVNKKIIIHNPKTTTGKWRKENVGIISRHGFSYGKIRVKAKLTELLNRNNMWNGITNAIWMIYQGDDGKWNLRRKCKEGGYMETYWGGPNDKRVPRVNYSEIDFEILKTPPYCPELAFPPVYDNPTNNPYDISSWNIKLPDEINHDAGNITVACTNWDMACWEPSNFGVGCNTIQYDNKEFAAHRWDDAYRAITEKSQQSDDLLFSSQYYYFEIEWKPAEIIWRIGPEPNQMRVVGYMNDKVTTIPNNQMLLIVTQEFHNTKWWPGSPYQQNIIPFPANDIFGEILDVVIE